MFLNQVGLGDEFAEEMSNVSQDALALPSRAPMDPAENTGSLDQPIDDDDDDVMAAPSPVDPLIPYREQPEFSGGFTEMVEFLTDLVQTGTAMQDLVAEILKEKIQDFENNENNEPNKSEFRKTREQVELIHAKHNAKILERSDRDIFGAEDLKSKIDENSSVLEEFVFWLSRLHYPDVMNHFFLHLLPNDEYKKELTRAFVKNYTFTAYSLTHSKEPDTLANRIVHISVQLLSNEKLVLEMVDKLDLLKIFLNSLTLLFHSTLADSNKEDRMNFSKVVDCHSELVQKTVYWSIVSDYNNIIHHQSVAKRLVNNTKILQKYLSVITWFTGMDMQKRALDQHVEYDRMFYVSFYLEKEGAAVPLSGIVTIIKKRMLDKAEVLKLWRAAVDCYEDYIDETGRTDGLDPLYMNQITFCLALPRLIRIMGNIVLQFITYCIMC